jgi:hypothetical protein
MIKLEETFESFDRNHSEVTDNPVHLQTRLVSDNTKVVAPIKHIIAEQDTTQVKKYEREMKQILKGGKQIMFEVPGGKKRKPKKSRLQSAKLP